MEFDTMLSTLKQDVNVHIDSKWKDIQRQVDAYCSNCTQKSSGCQTQIRAIEDRLAQGGNTMAILKERIDNLEKWQTVQNGSLAKIYDILETMAVTMNDLSLQLVAGRPSWATTIIITVLCSAVVGLLVALAKM